MFCSLFSFFYLFFVCYCLYLFLFYLFFFKQKTPSELRISDWSSDVCSSDLPAAEAGPREVLRLPESVTVSELAERMGKKIGEVIRELVGMGVMATINQPLEADKVKAVAVRFGFDADMRSADEDGGASCRERVRQSEWTSGVAGTINKK